MDQYDDLIQEKSPEELREIAKTQLEKPSARPMGMIDMDAIRSILRDETPSFSVSMHVPDEKLRREESEEKEKRHAALQSIRSEVMPTFCPKCSKFMGKSRFDQKFFTLRGMCFACNIKFETKLRIEGKWETYEAYHVVANKISFLRDIKQEAEEYLKNNLKRVYEIVSAEDGKIEKWNNEQYDDQKRFIENQIKEIDGYSEDLKSYFSELKDKLQNDNVIKT